MKTVATQTVSHSASDKKHKSAARSVPVIQRNVQLVAGVNSPVIQRKAASCVCGGGCPRCQEEPHHQPLQTKLQVSTPGDQYEQEADRVADQVMRMTESHADAGALLSARDPSPALQRKCAACEGAAPQATDEVAQSNVLPGAGQPLAESERAFFEPRFGRDFRGVRVHTDSRAAESARSVNARAYTVGRNIVFGEGQYAPETAQGCRLLAHELTHVIQQHANNTERIPTIQRQLSPAQPPSSPETISTSVPNRPGPPDCGRVIRACTANQFWILPCNYLECTNCCARGPDQCYDDCISACQNRCSV